MKKALLLLIIFTAAFSARLYAKNDTPPQLVITSEKFNYYRNKNYLEYIGEVKVVEDTRVLMCDFLRAYIDPENQVITFIRASGNVVITDGDRLLRASSAEYERIKKIIKLSGNPVLYEKESKITGDEIIIDGINETVEVRGNVRAELYGND